MMRSWERTCHSTVQFPKRLLALSEPRRRRHLYCDAVEFYNPVHDITLPIDAGRAVTLSMLVY